MKSFLIKLWQLIKAGFKALLKYRKEPPKTFWGKALDSIIYLVGSLLIFGGIAVLFWVGRPYAILYLHPSEKKALEQKAELGQVEGDRIIIPSVLIDAPLVEEITPQNLSRGVCFTSESSRPGQKGNTIIEGHNLAEFGLFKPQSFFSLLELVKKGEKIYFFIKGKNTFTL